MINKKIFEEWKSSEITKSLIIFLDEAISDKKSDLISVDYCQDADSFILETKQLLIIIDSLALIKNAIEDADFIRDYLTSDEIDEIEENFEL